MTAPECRPAPDAADGPNKAHLVLLDLPDIDTKVLNSDWAAFSKMLFDLGWQPTTNLWFGFQMGVAAHAAQLAEALARIAELEVALRKAQTEITELRELAHG